MLKGYEEFSDEHLTTFKNHVVQPVPSHRPMPYDVALPYDVKENNMKMTRI